MIYFDANIFVFAIMDAGLKGKKARELIGNVTAGRMEACTSYLTWDEVLWKIHKKMSRADALDAGKAFLRMPGMRFLDVDGKVIARANLLLETYGLHPRDAIHASSAIGAGAEMLSEDRDFDKVKGLKRKGL